MTRLWIAAIDSALVRRDDRRRGIVRRLAIAYTVVMTPDCDRLAREKTPKNCLLAAPFVALCPRCSAPSAATAANRDETIKLGFTVTG